MGENNEPKPLSERDKQTQPMPGEIDPKDAKAKVVLAMQKARQRIRVKKSNN